MEASCDGGKEQEGAVAAWMDGSCTIQDSVGCVLCVLYLT